MAFPVIEHSFEERATVFRVREDLSEKRMADGEQSENPARRERSLASSS